MIILREVKPLKAGGFLIVYDEDGHGHNIFSETEDSVKEYIEKNLGRPTKEWSILGTVYSKEAL